MVDGARVITVGGARRGRPMSAARMRRWSPRILPTIAVVAFSAAFIGWAAAGPAPRSASPVDGAASPWPSGTVTVAPPGVASRSWDASQPVTVAPARRTAPPPTTARPVPDRSLFTRTDPAPAGVPERISVVASDGSGCAEVVAAPGPPAVVVHDGPAELPVVAQACLVNFDRTQPVRATVTPPTGPARTTVVGPTDLAYFDVSFPLHPSDTAGTYVVSAEQGDAYATAPIVVVHPTGQRLWREARSADVLTAGDGVEFFLTGFPAGRPATLHLYGARRADAPATYRTSFTVPTDRLGNAQVTIATPHTLGSGCFVLTTEAVRATAQATNGSAVAFCVISR